MENQDGEARGQRWLGYSCPGCHTLFRVRVDSVGKRAECPRCGDIVEIPDEGATPAPTTRENEFREFDELAGGKKEQPGAPGSSRVRRKIKKKVRKKIHDEDPKEPEWEKDRRPNHDPRRTRRSLVLIAAAGLLIAIAAIVALKLTTGTTEEPGATGGEKVEDPGVGRPENQDPELADPEIAKVEMQTAILDIKAAVEGFLGAKGVEEMMPYVRTLPGMETRIREYYQGHPHQPVAYRTISPKGKVMKSGELWAVDIVLQDFSIRPIALERMKERYLVDWESWIGYSEIPWDDFSRERPTEPKLFRILLTPVNYYNFEFSDEKKWKCFRIESPDKGHMFYGYVPRYSTVDKKLTPLNGKRGDPKTFLVKLRYPDHAKSPQQVLISEVLGSGWVIPPEKK